MIEKNILDSIVEIEANDHNKENANMAAETPSGQMMNFASTTSKAYTEEYLLKKEYAEAHRNGDIHIHDLDFYPTKTLTCVQYPLADVFKGGFRTRHGYMREPQSILAHAMLAAIVFQTNQNEQHGGQAIPAFDFFMAPGVTKSFHKHLKTFGDFMDIQKDWKQKYPEYKTHIVVEDALEQKVVDKAIEKTKDDTAQAMESFIHNMNTMHSRGGNQVVFSSINYGTDTSDAGRLVIKSVLEATKAGLGHGETPVFPIQVFKVKEGVNYSEADIALSKQFITEDEKFNSEYTTPNFDLFLHAVKTTSIALFPNFVFLDTPFNTHEKWDANDPERYRYEIATMGCRTRVFENVNGEKTSVGRGNISFTTINLPRLAIQAAKDYENEEVRIKHFLASVRDRGELVVEQLHDRYEYQRTAYAKQFPFLMGQNIWEGGEQLYPNQIVGEIINSGTLGIGFIGGHNAMVALLGKSHGESEQSYRVLMQAVDTLNEVADKAKARYKLNFSVLATPAEGLSGRFTRMDQKMFGVIPGVNDREYYINSFHIDVKEDISLRDKIRKEGPFHAKTLGGHISYVELDGEAKQNLGAMLSVVQMMKDSGIGYGSINHPIDTCLDCNTKTIIYNECPSCGGQNIQRMRRITGYLTGALDSWNSAKKAEERDRVKHK